MPGSSIKRKIFHNLGKCGGEEPLYIALLENVAGQKRHIEKAPRILDDMTYAANPEGKDIYVYDDIARRLLLDDFFARLKLCYGNE